MSEETKMSKKKKVGIFFVIIMITWIYVSILIFISPDSVPCDPIGTNICLETIDTNEGKHLKLKIIDGTGIAENP